MHWVSPVVLAFVMLVLYKGRKPNEVALAPGRFAQKSFRASLHYAYTIGRTERARNRARFQPRGLLPLAQHYTVEFSKLVV